MLDCAPMRPPSLLFFTALSAVAGTASAEHIAAMLPQIKPAPAQELRERFHDAITRGLVGDGEVMPAAEVRRQLYPLPDLLECSWGACIPRVAKALAADRVVVTEIEDLGKTYSIRVRVFDADGQELGRSVDGRCEICSLREAEAAVQATASKASPLLLIKVATVAAKGDDAGPDAPRASPPKKPMAEVLQSSREARETAPETTEAPPSHTETPPSNESANSSATDPRAEDADRPAATDGRPFPFRPIAYAAFGLAVAALVPTIAFAIYAGKDGQPNCDRPDPVHTCPQIYSGNTGGAAAFGVVAGAAAITGAVLLLLDYRREKQRPVVTASPTRDGFAVGASFEF